MKIKFTLLLLFISLCGFHALAEDKPAKPLVGTGLVAGAAGADDKKVTEFAYRSGSGVDAVEYRVTASGLASISIGGNIMAKGRLEAQDFSGCLDFKNNYDWRKASRDKPWEFREKSIEVVNAKHARVVQKSAEVEATYDYLFAGEDVEVQCLLKNVTENTIFQGVDIGGLLFHFDREPTGLFNHLRVPAGASVTIASPLRVGPRLVFDLDVLLRSPAYYPALLPTPGAPPPPPTTIGWKDEHGKLVAGIMARDGTWRIWNGNEWNDSKLPAHPDIWNRAQLVLEADGTFHAAVQPLGQVPAQMGRVRLATPPKDARLVTFFEASEGTETHCYDNVKLTSDP